MGLFKRALFVALMMLLMSSPVYSNSVKLQDTTGTPKGVNIDSDGNLGAAIQVKDEFGNVTGHILGDNIFLGAPVFISSVHHEIHCGDSYEAVHNTTLGNGASIKYLITVPDAGTIDTSNSGADQSKKLFHFLEIIESEAEVEYSIYEGADRVAGTAIGSFNRDRNSSNTDTLTITHTPSGGTTDGSIIFGPWRVGSGRTDPGSRGRQAEFILKSNTKYIIVLENKTTSDNNINIEFDYYVHPGI